MIYNYLKKFILLSALPLIILPNTALANYFNLPVSGISPSTMGGAVIAGGDDFWNAWYNPANLATAKKLDIGFESAGIYNNATYLRRDDGQLATSNTLTPKFSGGVTATIGKKDSVTIGLHSYSLFKAQQDYQPSSIAGKTIFNDLQSAVQTIQLSIAVKLADKLFFGIGLQNHFITYRQQILLSSALPGDSLYDHKTEHPATLTSRDNLNISANFGLTVKINDAWTLAGSFQLPFSTSISGSITIDNQKGSFYSQLDYPLIARLGLSYSPKFLWAIEAAFVYEHLANQNELHLTTDVLSLPISSWQMPLNHQDHFSAHIGLKYHFMPQLHLRTGLLYQNSAVPDEYLTTYNYDSHKVGLGLGASYDFPFGLTINAGYIFYYYVARINVVSQVPPLNIISSDNTFPAIGNGDYGYGIHIFGLAIAFRL